MLNHASPNAADVNVAVTESAKALELRKFFAPQSPDNTLVQSALNDSLNKDGALDSYAEAMIWRLRGVHAMVSLIDRGTQYFLAGAMRAPKAMDDDTDDVVNEGNWFGCSTVLTPGGLCENTISLDVEREDYPCFVVNDLSKDSRFAQLPVVDGSIASYRFYAGTPITTKHGINIGSFFLFDDKPREGLNLRQRKLIHHQAANVMRHLEIKREAVERRRVALMSQGIAKFLERTRETDSTEGSITDEDFRNVHSSKASSHSSDLAVQNNSVTTPETSSASQPAQSSVLDKIRLTLDHAADILRESLELSVGGVVFLDSAVSHAEDNATDLLGPLVNFDKQQKDRPEIWRQELNEKTRDSKDARRNLSNGSVRSSADKHRATKVLAMSAAEVASWDAESKPLDTKTLHLLTKSYPKGNIWYIDDDGYFSSLEQIRQVEELPGINPSSIRRPPSPIDIAKRTVEGNMLSQVFRGARQIIFLPLWDAGGDQWYAGCFVWSKSAVPVFTIDSEVAYLSAFTNSVMVEISRLDAITSNKIKSDFISSISHEFRSPLHGILASAEFLRDSLLDASQIELVSTIQNCGGTLLDTINHVLDYSKINSFEQSDNQQGSIGNELCQVTNVALLCEDVVHGMIAAKEFRGTDGPDPASLASKESHAVRRPSDGLENTPMELIVDIEKRDWDFKVQPGALRRVIMNIFGNAQKYTESGYILLQLRILQRPQSVENVEKSTLFLRIRDTGRGMSSDYMERKLYHPFAQEDSFSTGVGLGLSIVWSIVNQLGGKVHIRSELGKGTDVEITLPIERVSEPLDVFPRPGDLSRVSAEAQKAVGTLRERASGKTVLISRRASMNIYPNLTRDISWACIEKYCSEWYGLKILTATDCTVGMMESATPDIIITDVHELYNSLDSQEHADGPKRGRLQRVLVVHDQMLSWNNKDRKRRRQLVGYICRPIGPFKLARCILSLLDEDGSNTTSKANQTDVSTQTPLASPDETSFTNRTGMSDYGFSLPTAFEIPLELQFLKQAVQESKSTASSPERPEQKTGQHAAIAKISQSISDLSLQPPLSPKTKPAQPLSTISNSPPPASKSSTTTRSRTATPSSTSSAADPPQTPLHILAVDDNALNLQLLQRYLRRRKTDVVVTAFDGLEAVAAVRAVEEGNEFDIIFMDISMPGMDGFEATRLIRSFERSHYVTQRGNPETLKHLCGDGGTEDRRAVGVALDGVDGEAKGIENRATESEGRRLGGRRRAYIVALTGLGSRKDREEAEKCGFDSFLTKPISFGEIGELLKRLSAEKSAGKPTGTES